MVKEIDVFDYAGLIMKQIEKGIHITVSEGDKDNPMTISWGHLGVQWNRRIFIAYVRDSRYTCEMLKKTKDFTVNIQLDKIDSKIIKVCGSKSGRDVNKIEDAGLTPVESRNITSRAIKELPLTLECRVVYTQKQNKDEIPESIKDIFYPKKGDKDYHRATDSYHTCFYGEIVDSYIIEE